MQPPPRHDAVEHVAPGRVAGQDPGQVQQEQARAAAREGRPHRHRRQARAAGAEARAARFHRRSRARFLPQPGRRRAPRPGHADRRSSSHRRGHTPPSRRLPLRGRRRLRPPFDDRAVSGDEPAAARLAAGLTAARLALLHASSVIGARARPRSQRTARIRRATRAGSDGPPRRDGAPSCCSGEAPLHRRKRAARRPVR